MTQYNVIVVATEQGLTALVKQLIQKSAIKHGKRLFTFGAPSLLWTAADLIGSKTPSSLKEAVCYFLDINEPVEFIDPSTAQNKYRFATGHKPQDGGIYIKHPILAHTYIQPGQYNTTLAKEKDAAFRQIASALGAKTIRLINIESNENQGFFQARVPLEDLISTINAGVKISKDGKILTQIYEEYGTPRGDIHLPKDLSEWVEFDPDLRTMARGRLEGNLLRTNITMTYERQSGMEGKLAASIESLEVELSGGLSSFYSSSWCFEVEYYEM